jgi:ribose transport system substrate-binding protein
MSLKSRMRLPRAAAVAALFSVAVTMANSASALTIAYSGYPGAISAFWASVTDAVKAEAAKEGITLLDLTTPDADPAAQKNAIDTAISQGVDGLIIGAIDNRAFDDTLKMAQEKKIPVVAVDTGIDHPWVKSLVQTDNLAAAGIAGKYIIEHAKKKGTVLILGGTEGHQTGNARRDGVKAAVEAAGFKTIFQICDWKDECAYDQTLTQTKANGEIAAIFAANDGMALAAENALKENGLAGDIIVVGFDGAPATFESIKAGEQAATVKQDSTAMGTQGVQNIVKIIKGDQVPALTPIAGILIDKSNVAEFIK